jgi:poly-gamma-glutamate synthesis protein (capsule biosynthesis protein)
MKRKIITAVPVIAAVIILGIVLFSTKHEYKPKKVTILFVGDVCFDWGVKKVIASGYDPFGYVKGLIGSATVAVFNLETPISTGGAKVEKTYNFRCPPDVLSYITNAGFDCAMLGNNHSMDYGPAALSDTLKYLKQYRLFYTGAGKNLKNAVVPIIIETNGFRIGILSFGYMNPPDLIADASKPGVAPIRPGFMNAEVGKLRPSVDFLIVSIHWGTEYVYYPNNSQKEMGHGLIDAGADLVIGHHPHILQGIEKYKNGMIFYSMGNFMFPQTDNTNMRATIIGMVELTEKIKDAKHKPAPVYSFIPLWRNMKTYDPEFPSMKTNYQIVKLILDISRGLNVKMMTLNQTLSNVYRIYAIDWK